MAKTEKDGREDKMKQGMEAMENINGFGKSFLGTKLVTITSVVIGKN